MFPVITTPKADRDSDVFFFYIAQESPKSALEFLERLEETYSIISEFPFIASVFPTSNPALSEIRWIPIKEFPNHLVFYSVNNQEITVIRILHKTQDIVKILA